MKSFKEFLKNENIEELENEINRLKSYLNENQIKTSFLQEKLEPLIAEENNLFSTFRKNATINNQKSWLACASKKAGIEQELMILQGDFLTYNYQIQELEKRVKYLKLVSQPTNE